MNRAEIYYQNAVRLVAGGTIQRAMCTVCGESSITVAFEGVTRDMGRCIVCGGPLAQEGASSEPGEA